MSGPAMNVRRASPPLDCYPALAGERRVALVIGNGAYRHTTRFPNPANDAHAIAAKLTMLGFEVVGGAENGIDLDYGAMARHLRSAIRGRVSDVDGV